MASPTSAQQPAQPRTAEESLKEFDTRMLNMVSRLDMTNTIFFYKLACKSMVTELLKGQYKYALEFPRDFFNQHNMMFNLEVTFVTPDSHQAWPIKLTERNFKTSKTRVYAYGVGGWKSFVIDNHIKVGDVLIFKLVRPSHFEVFIGRSPGEVHLDAEQDHANEDNEDRATL